VLGDQEEGLRVLVEERHVMGATDGPGVGRITRLP
jgi:hypothetical protein